MDCTVLLVEMTIFIFAVEAANVTRVVGICMTID